MENLTIGTIVKSIAGHDKNKFFVIINVENEYVYLVDGKCRPLDKPKKKKVKHVQYVANSEEFERLSKNVNILLDAHIRKLIRKTMLM